VTVNLPGRDIPWKDFFLQLKGTYKEDRLNDTAGALTFFGVLALFPFMLFLLSLASVIIQPQQAQLLIDELGAVAPRQATELLSTQIQALGEQRNFGLLSIGALGALWAASKGVVAMMRAFNVVYDVEEGRPFWKVRGIALAMVLVGGALGLLATLAAVVAPSIGEAIGGPLGTAIMWLRIPVAVVAMMFVWALAYYWLPDVEQDFRLITPGSVVGVLVWGLASWGFSVYVGNFGNYNEMYGTLGGVIIMLLWMWISALVLLLGAEINAILEHTSEEGKAKGTKSLGTGRTELTELSEEANRQREKSGRLPRGFTRAHSGQPPEELPFSPSQLSIQRRLERERALAQGRPKRRGRWTAAAWGAFIGLALVRLRGRHA
jgi:membrane protein